LFSKYGAVQDLFDTKKQESFGVIVGGPVTLTDTRECLKLLRGERAFGVYFQKMQCVQINYKMR